MVLGDSAEGIDFPWLGRWCLLRLLTLQVPKAVSKYCKCPGVVGACVAFLSSGILVIFIFVLSMRSWHIGAHNL